jgi:hypothetical protein
MPFYGVIVEESADAVAMLVRRLRESQRLPNIEIKRHGYDGVRQFFLKGKAQLSAWGTAGCSRAVVCCDCDDESLESRRQQLETKIIGASGVKFDCCPLVAVKEFEAWILADISKLVQVFSWCGGLQQHPNPESIKDPKEHLIRISRRPSNGRTYYHPPTHNVRMAELIDLDAVEERCSSFSVLAEFIRKESADAT